MRPLNLQILTMQKTNFVTIFLFRKKQLGQIEPTEDTGKNDLQIDKLNDGEARIHRIQIHETKSLRVRSHPFGQCCLFAMVGVGFTQI